MSSLAVLGWLLPTCWDGDLKTHTKRSSVRPQAIRYSILDLLSLAAFFSLSCLSFGEMGAVQGVVELSGEPQTMQQHRELASYRHHRPFLGSLAATLGYLQSVASEVRVLPKGTEDVLRAANQETSQYIEEAFAKIKNLVRKAATRSKEALVEAVGAALCAVTAEDAWGYFEHAGYRPTGQPL